jgi:hypothetical protein
VVGVSSRTSCRQLFKELNIFTLALLYIFNITCFVRKYCQSLEQNSKVHQYNTRRKLDIHVKLQNTEIHKKCVINIATNMYNNLPKFLKETDDYKAVKKVKTVPSSSNFLLSGRICIFLAIYL